MGRIQFTNFRESFTTRKPANKLDACLSTVGTGCHKGAGVLHFIEGHLDGLHYQQNLQIVTVPSVRTLYPYDIRDEGLIFIFYAYV